MKNILICIFVLCGIAFLSSAVAGQDCKGKGKDNTTLTVTLPDDVKKAPTVDPESLCVKKNGKIKVKLVAKEDDAQVKISFQNDKTPLANGNKKEKIKKAGKELKIKRKCGSSCEYKYKVYDATKDSTRPPLDPLIIIDPD